ncbi:MAG: nitrate reductase molybdenum cofactor assembly chaperone [Parahaliea sp.]
MRILKLLAHLLDYPTGDLIEHRQEIMDFIRVAADLDEVQRGALIGFLQDFDENTLLDRQSEYDGLFERGRSLSLHFFEHMHGESRDRGQAMVDLLAQYREAGLDIGVRELPDYLPLYLEFASTQAELAQQWLQDIAPILALLTVRSQQRESRYGTLFALLLQLSDADIDLESLRGEVKGEQRDDTPQALDKVWEEEVVSFVGAGNDGCGGQIPRPGESQRRDMDIPLRILDPKSSPSSPLSAPN